MAALLSTGLLLIFLRGTFTDGGPGTVPIQVTVVNDQSNLTPETFSSWVVEGGVLLGALRRLQETQPGFTFTVKEDPDFGLFLESVNGVAGDERRGTYWEVLSEIWGEQRRVDLGIGCYAPKEDERIVLRFSSWTDAEVAARRR